MHRNKTKGFTIVEVLVSLVILSIGVLGLGVLQIAAMQNTQGGYLRSQATILVYDMIDSMRVNSPAITSGAYALTFAAATPVAVNCYGAAANCTSGQMAASDINRWRTSAANYLPNGNGQILTVANGTTTLVTVSVQWTDPYTAQGGAAEQVTLLAELR